VNIREQSWTYKGEKHTARRFDARSRRRGQRQFKTRREAELARDAIIRDHEAGIYGVSLDPNITFKAFVDIYVEKKTGRPIATASGFSRLSASYRSPRNDFLAWTRVRSLPGATGGLRRAPRPRSARISRR